MALVVKDRVLESSTTTGTGTLTLSGASTGYQTFSNAIGNGNTTYYAISVDNSWEVGLGTVGAGTLSRDTVLESSNSNSLVDFSAGIKTVFCTYPAERSVYKNSDESLNLPITIFDSYGNVKSLFETATISGSAPASTTNYDVITQSVQYYTSNSTANFTLNIRGSSGATLNSILLTGQSASVALMVTNGATPYYPNVIQIDGSAVTPKWQGGTAITSGSANSIDVYLFTIVKTASTPTYTMFASQTKFA
jgi:hypothetical protein